MALCARAARRSPNGAIVMMGPKSCISEPKSRGHLPNCFYPGRRAVEVGALVVQQIEGERNGPCREINFDPTILPNSVHVSNDDLRTSELKYYPYHSEAAGGGER